MTASPSWINAEIDTAIEAVLPVLELGRSYANRVINDSRRNDDENDDDDEDEDDEPTSKSSKSTRTKKKKSDEDDAMPAWAKKLIESNEQLKSELAAVKGEKISDTRRSRLEKLLKDTGAFGTSALKSFSKMKFESDDDFEEFFSDVQEDLKSLNQERANAGLEKLGAPAAGSGSGKKEEKPEVLSEEEIKAIAAM